MIVFPRKRRLPTRPTLPGRELPGREYGEPWPRPRIPPLWTPSRNLMNGGGIRFMSFGRVFTQRGINFVTDTGHCAACNCDNPPGSGSNFVNCPEANCVAEGGAPASMLVSFTGSIIIPGNAIPSIRCGNHSGNIEKYLVNALPSTVCLGYSGTAAFDCGDACFWQNYHVPGGGSWPWFLSESLFAAGIWGPYNQVAAIYPVVMRFYDGPLSGKWVVQIISNGWFDAGVQFKEAIIFSTNSTGDCSSAFTGANLVAEGNCYDECGQAFTGAAGQTAILGVGQNGSVTVTPQFSLCT